MLVSILIIAFGAGFIWGALISSDTRQFGILFLSTSSFIEKIFLFLFGGIISLFGLYLLWLSYSLDNESIVIGKKSQSIIIRKDSKKDFLKSLKEIPFSQLDRIEIYYDDEINSWYVGIKTIQRRYVPIYQSQDKHDAKSLAEKVSRITGKRILHWAI